MQHIFEVSEHVIVFARQMGLQVWISPYIKYTSIYKTEIQLSGLNQNALPQLLVLGVFFFLSERAFPSIWKLSKLNCCIPIDYLKILYSDSSTGIACKADSFLKELQKSCQLVHSLYVLCWSALEFLWHSVSLLSLLLLQLNLIEALISCYCYK